MSLRAVWKETPAPPEKTGKAPLSSVQLAPPCLDSLPWDGGPRA